MRYPAVAGQFYAGSEAALRKQVEECFLHKLGPGQLPEINQNGQRMLMFYWYQTRGGAILNDFAVKWDLAVNALRLRRTDASFIRVTVPLQGGDISDANRRAEGFLRAMHTSIMQALTYDN